MFCCLLVSFVILRKRNILFVARFNRHQIEHWLTHNIALAAFGNFNETIKSNVLRTRNKKRANKMVAKQDLFKRTPQLQTMGISEMRE